jgi:uncharacterized protein
MLGLESAGLIGAGFMAGMMNALAGGGGFVVLPTLMMAGSSAILANTTGSVAVWPGVIATVLAYRKGLGSSHRKALPFYIILVMLGSLGGSALLLFTSNEVFVQLLPWLLLGATLLFLTGPKLTQALRNRRVTSDSSPPKVKFFWIGVLMTLIAIYGGYFGGGMGIMTLAALSLLGIEDIHELNAVKSILIFFISTINVLYFIVQGAVVWKLALPVMLGNLVGGYAASHWAVNLPKAALRRVISGVCVLITVAYFIKSFR